MLRTNGQTYGAEHPTHADRQSRESKALICVCLYVCRHDRTKTADTTITKLATWVVHHELVLASHIMWVQKVKVQNYRVTRCKNIEGDRVAGLSLHSIECSPSSFYNIIIYEYRGKPTSRCFQWLYWLKPPIPTGNTNPRYHWQRNTEWRSREMRGKDGRNRPLPRRHHCTDVISSNRGSTSADYDAQAPRLQETIIRDDLWWWLSGV